MLAFINTAFKATIIISNSTDGKTIRIRLMKSKLQYENETML